MDRVKTSRTHQARADRVLAYIYEHLDEELDLEKLAEVACLSPHHWHRVHRAIAGETLAQTVRRLRLHRAAHDLVYTDEAIEVISTSAGYGSAEAFSRAFKTDYGQPPAQYRSATQNFTDHLESQRMSEDRPPVEIRTLPSRRLAVMTHKGPHYEIGKTFEPLFVWAQANNLIHMGVTGISVYFDNPEIVPPQDLRSFAGIPVPDTFEPKAKDDLIQIYETEPGAHAVLTHRGPYSELGKAYGYLYGTWFPQNNLVPTARPCLEENLNDPKTTPPQSLVTEISIPLDIHP